MTGNNQTMTFSVRQLALMFGRSEQTVRRWKDQGQIRAGLPGVEDSALSGGALVFTLEAVQDFLRQNPRVMNTAKREFITEFMGEDGVAILRSGMKKPAVTAQNGGSEPLFERMRRMTAELSAEAGFYVEDDGEEAADDRRDDDDYLLWLMGEREKEIDEERKALRSEREQVFREAEQLRESGGSGYLLRLLEERDSELRARELELIRENSALVRDRMSGNFHGGIMRFLLLEREKTLCRNLEEMERELELIRRKKVKLGIVVEV